ncbi:response regulator transcription factor [Aquimarina muelleri]|uniref:HTH luxR-type domain-containing protein n=1 Tax=Aquimarina muelleri TaxID=279356 RepID=A0A918N271_9FLAO|nr:LuxR C-terminal-related transcriptional regulator [Aquimarina muelleri]MCX2761912.1 LuxR C-terminal-related transcriptional regulator [Aquimarina muelleri]GGX10301.1 hypothetical protein GCM10007384_10030 [Aquimarina muelleri]
MKNLNFILTILLLIGVHLFGQNCVSGYVNIENPEQWESKVYLSQVQLKENLNNYNVKTIASSSITKEGFFNFDKSLFTSTNLIYKVHVNALPKKEKDILFNKIKNFELFILSKNDTIFFNKGKKLFDKQTSDNIANREWKKLKKFEARYENLTSDFDPKQYLIETKGYVKDSLQILLVKLIGIKRLDDQNLLEKDVRKNPDYYTSLLKELKSSELDPSTYVYLENKLRFIDQKIVNKKYNISIWINGIAFLIIALLSFIYIRSVKKQKKTNEIPLSNQEKVIKDLIISGKSNKEIANELFISLSTVKTHITNIYNKLNISSRQDLLLKK